MQHLSVIFTVLGFMQLSHSALEYNSVFIPPERTQIVDPEAGGEPAL